MGTIVRLLVMLAIVNAAARGGQAAWHHYQFEDEAQRVVQFAGTATVGDLHAEILGKAPSYSIDLTPEQLTVRRENTSTIAEASYSIPVEWFPGYVRPIPFSFQVEAFSIAGAAPVRRR